MARRCNWKDLTAAITEELENYSEEAASAVKRVAKDKAQKAKQEIAAGSPKKTGSYAGGWRVKRLYDGENGIRLVVYNATDYQLTHLLEKGHALRDGGRLAGTPHIAPVEQEINEEFSKEVKELLQK